jgi:hypothetical protein
VGIWATNLPEWPRRNRSGQDQATPRFGGVLDFAPRIGLVYDPKGRGTETIRAGYGMFYDSSSICGHTSSGIHRL